MEKKEIIKVIKEILEITMVAPSLEDHSQAEPSQVEAMDKALDDIHKLCHKVI